LRVRPTLTTSKSSCYPENPIFEVFKKQISSAKKTKNDLRLLFYSFGYIVKLENFRSITISIIN